MKIGENVKIKFSNPQKAHPWRKARRLSVEWWRFILRCDLYASRRKKKEGRKKDTRNNGKLAIRPDHPRRRIKITLCMVGGLRCVVICFKKPSTSANGLRRCGGRKWPSITLASGLYNSLYGRTSRDLLCRWNHTAVVFGRYWISDPAPTCT